MLIALSAEHGFTDWLALATILRGWAMAEQGRNEEGIAQIQEGLAAFRATGAGTWRAALSLPCWPRRAWRRVASTTG